MKEDRIAVFLEALETGEKAYLEEIEEQALKDYVPIIRKSTQSFLKVLLQIKQPKNILEIGTAVGFSSLLMSEYAKEAKITTIENYEKRIPIALDNIKKAGKEDRITLIPKDAAVALKELEGPFDFIFLDGAKAQYIHYLDDLLRLMEEGALLVTDNVLQDGEVIESRYSIRRRDRTIHARMREYLYEIKHNKNLLTSINPVGDGVSVSVYRSEDE
ncbi:MAG TPA: O-methyltransferase [Candidatus Dorea intestinavium]|nr:O-methyltransferase [Candidatus Dorea intestinavium]